MQDGVIVVPYVQRLDADAQHALREGAQGVQKVDLVLPLLKVWMAQDSKFNIRWPRDIEYPRDWHGLSLLCDLPAGISGAEFLLDTGAGFDVVDLQLVYDCAQYNSKVCGLTNLLVAFVSESPAALRELPLPPQTSGLGGIAVTHLRMLLRRSGEWELAELGSDLREVLDDNVWMHSEDEDAARRAALRPTGHLPGDWEMPAGGLKAPRRAIL
ncbi:MAG: hypothetical protein M3P85_13020 [Actinomycetota bacterium]|nr:hypothetical protein [Actinomycetota bacterium]